MNVRFTGCFVEVAEQGRLTGNERLRIDGKKISDS
jgi:hypothetical protein